jgi:type II secretory ATPase GspE/PulE/Tfp pilus assembly ATPase PilB-like protein
MESAEEKALHDTALVSGSGAPPVLLAGAGFTANDVALCSSEEARALLACDDALSLCALPLAIQRGRRAPVLHVAATAEDEKLENRLTFLCGMKVSLTAVPADILRDAIPRAYFGSDAYLLGQLKRIATSTTPAPRKNRRELPRASGDAAQVLTALLEFAAVRGASDLHLAPGPHAVLVKMRVDGELLVLDSAPYELHFHEQIVSRLKVLAELDIAKRRVPQDGAFSSMLAGCERSLRVSTLPTSHGESIVVRFLHLQKIPALTQLGMEPRVLERLREATNRSEGLILLTGPTGSGKTTTMYSVVKELEGRGRNVVTVEDPIEAPIPRAVQVQVCLEQGLDYPRAIRSVLRHDPDVLLIGEMRDGISAAMSLDAASTGHLTLSSLHIGSSLHVFSRLEVLGVARARAVPPVAIVVNQRLLPKLCGKCKRLDDRSRQSFKDSIFCGVGCVSCGGTGFSGRVLITEILDVQSQSAKDACYKADSARELLQLLPNQAFIPWTEALHHHLLRGDIALRQVEEFLDSEIA